MTAKKKIQTILVLLFCALPLATITFADQVKRSNFLVEKLSCGSCLAAIEQELKKLNGALGMEGDIRSGMIVVDHRRDLSDEEIANRISGTGYPARVNWSADISSQKSISFGKSSKYTGGCGGGCSTGGSNAGGPRVWNPTAAGKGEVLLTTMQVSNLSCISCLTTIENSLRTLVGTIGMDSDLNRGLVAVKHSSSLSPETIAQNITELGYPARVVNKGKKSSVQAPSPIQPKKTYANYPVGRSNCDRKGCNATATAWKKLYRKYVNQASPK